MVTARSYDDLGNLLSESNNIAGPLAGIAVTNCFDQFFRRTGLGVFSTDCRTFADGDKIAFVTLALLA